MYKQPEIAPYSLKFETAFADLKACPCCGRFNCFVPYVHRNNKSILPGHIGQCNRPACGYQFSAKKFFIDQDGVYSNSSYLQPGNSS